MDPGGVRWMALQTVRKSLMDRHVIGTSVLLMFRSAAAWVQANQDIRTFVWIRLGGAGGARTHDRRIMRSAASCTEHASCTDGTDYRTDDTRRTGIIGRAGPRTGPRGATGNIP